jgi:hypothetical protein
MRTMFDAVIFETAGNGRKSHMRITLLCSWIAVAAVLSLTRCSGPTLYLHTGPLSDRSKMAVVRSGAYTTIEAVDDVKVPAPYLNVVVSPGSHIVSVAFKPPHNRY